MKKVLTKTATIVGAASGQSWVQTHIFLPEGKRIYSSGSLMATFFLKAKDERIEVISFGKEIISRFHEIYYSSDDSKIFHRLELSLAQLNEEFKDKVELSIIVGIILERKDEAPVVYFYRLGKGKAYIYRQGKLVDVLPSSDNQTEGTSGFLEDNDFILLATSQFFETISLPQVELGFQLENPEAIVESWTPTIHGGEENSETAAIVIKTTFIDLKETELKENIETIVETKTDKLKIKEKINQFVKICGAIPTFTIQFIRSFKRDRELFLRDNIRTKRSKRTTLMVAIILIGLLVVSIFFGTKEKTRLTEKKKTDMVLEEVNNKYNQAGSLKEVNPLRAQSLLQESKDLIQQSLIEITKKDEKEKLADLLKKVEKELMILSKEYLVENPKIFIDFQLVKEGFRGEDWSKTDSSSLFVLDSEKVSVLQVDLKTKASQVVAGGDEFKGAMEVGGSPNRIFLLNDNSIQVIDIDGQKLIASKEGENWGQIQQMFAFSGNVYLLDTQKETIWKYIGIDDGLASGKEYLVEPNPKLKEAVSLAIDGSVWVLLKDGEIIKFTRGKEDAFVLTGLDRQFNEPAKIYTDENLDDLYILDIKNTRIVIINKETGEYKEQYVWNGIAGATNITVDEKEAKILLLTGQRIYEIELMK